MTNNLRTLRHRRGWTQQAAADALGTTRNQYVKLERGSRRLSELWIERAALAFGLDTGDIVRGAPAKISVLGYIDAAGWVSWATAQPADAPGEAGMLVRGDHFGPLFDGWMLVVDCERQRSAALVDGGVYLLSLPDGRSLVRRTVRAAGRLHLTGQLVAPIFDSDVDWGLAVKRLIAA